MSLVSPRGLKIRVPLRHGFALMARLWAKDPSHDAFRILKTCEGLVAIPSMLSWCAGMVTLLYSGVWWHVFLSLVVGRSLGVLINSFGFYHIPGIIPCARWWSYLAGFGLFLGVASFVLGIFGNWLTFFAWMAAYPFGLFIEIAASAVTVSYYHRVAGVPLSQSEIVFFNAYRLHAAALGETISINVTEAEIETGKWARCLRDYAAKWPRAVSRFEPTQDLIEAIYPFHPSQFFAKSADGRPAQR